MAESTAREEAIVKKSDNKKFIKTILQGITPQVPVAEQELLSKLNRGENVSMNTLKNFAKKYFERVKAAGIEVGSRAYKNAQYAAAQAGLAGEYKGKPHKKGGAVKKYSHGGAVHNGTGHALTYKR